MDDNSPQALRSRIRDGQHQGTTSGYVPGYVQCNIVILPQSWATDFLQFCLRNPKPCPLVAVGQPGDPSMVSLGDIDIRSDVPRYRIYRNGELVEERTNINELWQDDMVTFALGCSFSFEEALMADGLEVRNVAEGVNVPMYRTNIECQPSGPFTGNMVVSMRPYNAADAIRAIQVCTRFPSVHGAPIHLGDPTQIGITDLTQPDFGEPVSIKSNEMPVFWACGVTPQVALEQAKPPLCITHSPGCMLVTDLPNSRLAIL